jgi:hypothetical protein
MSCGGGHLGFPIGIKCRNLAKDIFSMIIHLQFGSVSSLVWPIGTKLSMNVPGMVLYNVSVFRSSRIFNMAAITNNMLCLAEISKIFFSETNELTEPNCK